MEKNKRTGGSNSAFAWKTEPAYTVNEAVKSRFPAVDSESSIMFGSKGRLFSAGLAFACLLLLAIGAIGFISYALMSGQVYFIQDGVSRAGASAITLALQLIVAFFILQRSLKTVEKAEITGHRLKMNMVLREVDLPVESIQDLILQRHINVEKLVTRDGDFIFVYQKGDEGFANALREYINPNSANKLAKVSIKPRHRMEGYLRTLPLFLLGLMFLYLVFAFGGNSISWFCNGQQTEATVLKVVTNFEDDNTTYSCKLRFKLPSGESFEAESPDQTTKPSYKIGQKISILFDETSPDNINLTSREELLAFPAIMFLFGLALTSPMLIIALSHRRDSLRRRL